MLRRMSDIEAMRHIARQEARRQAPAPPDNRARLPASRPPVLGSSTGSTDTDAVANAGDVPEASSGVYADLPASSADGGLYFVTDAPRRVYRWNGSSWDLQATADHGSLAGLGDDDHTQYVKHALAAAASDFLCGADVGGGVYGWIKKTLAEVKTILGLGTAAYTAAADYALVAGRTDEAQTCQGYFTAGAGNTGMKRKVLSVDTPAAQGSSAGVAHGLDSTKIVGLTAIVIHTSGQAIGPEYSWVAGYQFSANFDATNVNVITSAANAANILSKPAKIILDYTA